MMRQGARINDARLWLSIVSPFGSFSFSFLLNRGCHSLYSALFPPLIDVNGARGGASVSLSNVSIYFGGTHKKQQQHFV